jgi:hypothetical protein
MKTFHLVPEPTGGGYSPVKCPAKPPWRIEDGVPVATVEASWLFKGAAGTVAGWELRDGDRVIAKGDYDAPLVTCLGATATASVDLTV